VGNVEPVHLNLMNRVNCTCNPSESLPCAYCRCETIRLERLYREVESFAAMKATVGVKLITPRFRRGPYRTEFVQYGKIVKKLEAA
jgi:hypothetical protein